MWLPCHLAVSGTVCQVGRILRTRPANAEACSMFLLRDVQELSPEDLLKPK